MALSIIETRDGSHTLYDDELDEIYHSHHGAIAESRHVFINAGLLPILDRQDTVNILEVGMGTGLNVLLTALELTRHPEKKVSYRTTEPFSPSTSIVEAVNYSSHVKEASAADLFKNIHRSEWEVDVELTAQLNLYKTVKGVQDIDFANSQFDLIYFDAFAPAKAPELWKPEIFLKLFQMAAPGGALVTYCAQGQFKRDLRSAGFIVEDLPGPPGKRSMTRGGK